MRRRTRSSGTWARSSTTSRRTDAGRRRRPAARTSSSPRSSRSSVRRSTSLGTLKREVALYAFDRATPPARATTSRSAATGTTGSTPAPARTSPTATPATTGSTSATTTRTRSRTSQSGHAQAHDQVDAAWGGSGHDHLWGGYGADYLDVRPRSAACRARSRPDERPGDVVPDRGCRGLAQRRRLRPGQLREHRLPVRRLGSGLAAGERGRQRPGIRATACSTGAGAITATTCVRDVRRLGLDAGDRARPDRLPAEHVLGRRRRDRGDLRAGDHGGHVGVPRDGDRVRERGQRTTRIRSIRIRRGTSPAGPASREIDHRCAGGDAPRRRRHRLRGRRRRRRRGHDARGHDRCSCDGPGHDRCRHHDRRRRGDDDRRAHRRDRDPPRAGAGPEPLGGAGRRGLQALAGADRCGPAAH